ncbi:hypothetical protein MIMGU_mgv11b017274mg, partial [Erythranthe guttata]
PISDCHVGSTRVLTKASSPRTHNSPHLYDFSDYKYPQQSFLQKKIREKEKEKLRDRRGWIFRKHTPFQKQEETTSRRLADRKVERFEKNITKRGAVPETTTKKGNDFPVGPVLLGFFIFVVIGSSLFQIIRTATSGGMA